MGGLSQKRRKLMPTFAEIQGIKRKALQALQEQKERLLAMTDQEALNLTKVEQYMRIRYLREIEADRFVAAHRLRLTANKEEKMKSFVPKVDWSTRSDW
jgi:hypothetical protein